MKIRFVAEKGNKGQDDVEVLIAGIKNLPKHLIITAEDFTTPIGTGKAYISENILKIEADIREQEFGLYPTIGIESIFEESENGTIVVRESELHTISLQPHPNSDPDIKTLSQQLEDGTAVLFSDD